MDKRSTYNGVSLRHEKDGNLATCDNGDHLFCSRNLFSHHSPQLLLTPRHPNQRYATCKEPSSASLKPLLPGPELPEAVSPPPVNPWGSLGSKALGPSTDHLVIPSFFPEHSLTMISLPLAPSRGSGDVVRTEPDTKSKPMGPSWTEKMTIRAESTVVYLPSETRPSRPRVPPDGEDVHRLGTLRLQGPCS